MSGAWLRLKKAGKAKIENFAEKFYVSEFHQPFWLVNNEIVILAFQLHSRHIFF